MYHGGGGGGGGGHGSLVCACLTMNINTINGIHDAAAVSKTVI